MVPSYTITAVREGIALLEEGPSPYAGDIFHEVISYQSVLLLYSPFEFN